MYIMTNEDKISDIMSRFDFGRVHKIMKALNWEWIGEGVPTVKSIKHTALTLLKGVCLQNSSDYYILTGGFKAGTKDGILYLKFIVESAETID